MSTTQSNQSGLRLAVEATPKNLPGSPVWYPFEPNSYNDFGGEFSKTARAPIAGDRQRRKGVVSDLTANGGFEVDFTDRSFAPVMEGFVVANAGKKDELAVTAVTSTEYTVASGGNGYVAGDLVFAESMSAGNSGLGLVTGADATGVEVSGLTAEAVNSDELPRITRVGYQFASGDLDVTVSGDEATIATTTKDLTDLGLVPGEWFFVGGDATDTALTTSASNGFYRVKTIDTNELVCDRIPTGAATDAGTGKTVRVFIGAAYKNEADPDNQVIRTYHMERALTSSKVEYVTGACPNSLQISAQTSDKLTTTIDFMGLDTENATAKKAGARPSIKPQSAFSSATDFSRLRILDAAANVSLATFMTDLSITIENNVEVDKALGSLGGIAHSLGDFVVTGDIEAYFSTFDAVDAVRENKTISVDFAMVVEVFTPGVGNQAAGWLFDIPALTLGDARLNVEKDRKVKLPLSLEAHADLEFNHTLMAVHFAYLPDLAL